MWNNFKMIDPKVILIIKNNYFILKLNIMYINNKMITY